MIPGLVDPKSGRRVAALALVWLLITTAVGASGRLAALRPPGPQITLLMLTIGLVVACRTVPWLRIWAFHVDLRVLVAIHLARFVGVYFLSLYRRGELPFAFAVPGGWGDIAVAGLALLLLLSGPPDQPFRRVAYAAWNVAGLVDIVYVVLTAARLGITRPDSITALVHLPLSLLPTFLVPMLIATHLLIGTRLAQRADRSAG